MPDPNTPTPRTDGLPAGMELGTVYLFPFLGGSGTLYEFVSAVSYHELERELADLRQQLAECEQREIALMNDVVGGAQPCCQEWETCQHRCVPRAEYFKQRLAEVQTAGGTTEPK